MHGAQASNRDTGVVVVRNNKKLRAAAFWIIFTVLLVISSYMIAPFGGEVYDVEATRKKISDIDSEKKNSIDVIFAGNSLVFHALSPLQIWEMTGITSYDLSDGAMRLCDQLTLIRAVCEDQSPKVLILEADPLFNDSSPYKDDYAIPTNLIEKLLPVFHHHTFYKAFKPGVDPAIRSIKKGFQPSYDVDPYDGAPDYMNDETDFKKQKEILPANLDYLDRIVDFCSERNITLVIAALPSPKNYSWSVHNKIRTWADENDLEFVDLNLMNEKIGLDWSTDTKDGGDHVNFEGSKKISAFVSDYLKERYELKDHRQDDYYENWHDDYERSGLY